MSFCKKICNNLKKRGNNCLLCLNGSYSPGLSFVKNRLDDSVYVIFSLVVRLHFNSYDVIMNLLLQKIPPFLVLIIEDKAILYTSLKLFTSLVELSDCFSGIFLFSNNMESL